MTTAGGTRSQGMSGVFQVLLLQQFGPFLKTFAHILKSCIHNFQTIGTQYEIRFATHSDRLAALSAGYGRMGSL